MANDVVALLAPLSAPGLPGENVGLLVSLLVDLSATRPRSVRVNRAILGRATKEQIN